jgi:hypothetical protein
MTLRFSQLRVIRKAISPLFSVNLNWPSLTEVREVEDDSKYEVALKICEQWLKENPNSLFKNNK